MGTQIGQVIPVFANLQVVTCSNLAIAQYPFLGKIKFQWHYLLLMLKTFWQPMFVKNSFGCSSFVEDLEQPMFEPTILYEDYKV